MLMATRRVNGESSIPMSFIMNEPSTSPNGHCTRTAVRWQGESDHAVPGHLPDGIRPWNSARFSPMQREKSMVRHSDILSELSNALVGRTAAAKNSVTALKVAEGWYLSATVWSTDVLVASEQSLPHRSEFEAVAPGGKPTRATTVGRDPATNLAVLRLADPLTVPPVASANAAAGQLVLAIGADGEGGARARLGVVNLVGAEWQSSRGGRIEQRLLLDISLSPGEEGGPVFDVAGALLGISTFGPRGRVLVIPTATLERVIPTLLVHGKSARGWLGVALQPVAIPDALRDEAKQSSGLMVMSIVEAGPGAKAGLVAGDILLSVDGTATPRVRDLARQLGTESIGQQAEVHLIRGGSIVSVQALIAERPDS
jgi:S1-C subfamily serine protease